MPTGYRRAPAPRCIGIAVPMKLELDPIVERLGLVSGSDSWWRGRTGESEILATITTIGMVPAADATERLIRSGADWILVVGIAGAIDAATPIGSVLVPDRVTDRAASTTLTPHPVPGFSAGGAISCGDDLLTDPDTLAELSRAGFVALDMESAAVGARSERHGCPWTVVRAISDHAGGPLLDPELMTLTGPDGRADAGALDRYLAADPTRAQRLHQLSADTARAAAAAADMANSLIQALAGGR